MINLKVEKREAVGGLSSRKAILLIGGLDCSKIIWSTDGPELDCFSNASWEYDVDPFNSFKMQMSFCYFWDDWLSAYFSSSWSSSPNGSKDMRSW